MERSDDTLSRPGRPWGPRLAVAGVLAAVALAAHWPLFHRGMFVSDEELHWLRRLSEFDFALRSGQWWPRWFVNLEWGYGYPYPNFYAPGGLWLSWFCYLITRSYLWGVKGAFLIAGGLAPWGMYRFLRPGVSRPAALVGALLFGLAPYHTLNIFVRGNLAEYLAMGLFPWVLWGLSRLTRRNCAKDIFLAAVLICLYQLSHNLSALFGSLIFGFWVIARPPGRVTLRMIVAMGFGTLMGAIYWLPAAWDAQDVQIREVATQIVAADHTIYPWQLIDPRWGWGYSVPGPTDEISLQIGLVQFGLLIFAMLALFSQRFPRSEIFWIVLAGVLLLIVMPWAAPLWRLPVLELIQFPWRLLAWIAVAVAIVGASVIDAWPHCRRMAVAIPLIVLSLFPLAYVRGEFWRDVNVYHFTPEFTRQYVHTNTTAGEYLPRLVQEPPARPAAVIPYPINNPVQLAPIEISPFFRVVDVEAEEPTLIAWDVYSFPNWTLTIDGEVTGMRGVRPDGVLLTPCPAGMHRLGLAWAPTSVHRLAAAISALTLLGLLVSVLLSERWGRGQMSPRRSEGLPCQAGATVAQMDATECTGGTGR